MAKTIGRNTNLTDVATLSDAIALNTMTSTTIATANANRIVFIVSNPSNMDIWLKLQAANVDNVKKGIFITKGTVWTMPTDNIYTGEISAIGNLVSLNVYVTEY